MSSQISSEIRQRTTFFCPRGGSGTESGGRAAFRRRVAGDWEMAPDTKLHPGQFAFAFRPSERHASGTSFAFGSGKREFSWLRRAVERPFVRCSGNDSKVAFRPGKLKGVSSRKQSEYCQNFGAPIMRRLAQVSHCRGRKRSWARQWRGLDIVTGLPRRREVRALRQAAPPRWRAGNVGSASQNRREIRRQRCSFEWRGAMP